METLSTVFVVGELHEVHDWLDGMATAGRLAIRRFAAAGDALDYCEPQMPGCFVLDHPIRGVSGLRVHEQLHAKGCQQPFLCVLSNGDVASAVEAMHRGALDCIERPVNRDRLLSCVLKGIAQDADLRDSRAQRAGVMAQVESLTPRERQILEYVATGEITKTIARLLSISPKTVEVHRSNIMRKMHVESAAGLFHLIARYALFPLATDACRITVASVVNESPSTEGQWPAGLVTSPLGSIRHQPRLGQESWRVPPGGPDRLRRG
jgi:FixJ family two-component response regulator